MTLIKFKEYTAVWSKLNYDPNIQKIPNTGIQSISAIFQIGIIQK